MNTSDGMVILVVLCCIYYIIGLKEKLALAKKWQMSQLVLKAEQVKLQNANIFYKIPVDVKEFVNIANDKHTKENEKIIRLYRRERIAFINYMFVNTTEARKFKEDLYRAKQLFSKEYPDDKIMLSKINRLLAYKGTPTDKKLKISKAQYN